MFVCEPEKEVCAVCKGWVYRWIGLMMVLALLGAATGCQTKDSSSRPVQLVVAQEADATTMDPQATLDVPTENVLMNIYEGLVERGNDMKVNPLLAESYTALDDRTWEFKLRKGVQFHNGEPFTADAVKFTLDRILDESNKIPGARYYKVISEVKVVDPATVTISTHDPYPLLPELLLRSEARILPPQYVGEKGAEYLAAHPVGTGPFVFGDWVRDEKVVLKANEHYWRGRPKVDELVFRAIPERATRITELLAGSVDIALGLADEDRQRLEGNADVEVKVGPTTRVVFLGFMHNKEPMGDVRVRQAILHALDVESLVANLYGGNAYRTPTLVSPFFFGYNDELKPYAHDVGKARELLAEAGYPNGLTLSFDCPSGRYPKDTELARAITGQLAEAGIRAELRTYEWGTYMTKSRAGDFGHIFLIGTAPAVWDAHNVLEAYCHSRGPLSRGYDSPEVDGYLDQARTSVDPEVRKQALMRAQELIYQDATQGWLFQFGQTVGVRKGVRWEPRPDERTVMWGATKH